MQNEPTDTGIFHLYLHLFLFLVRGSLHNSYNSIEVSIALFMNIILYWPKLSYRYDLVYLQYRYDTVLLVPVLVRVHSYIYGIILYTRILYIYENQKNKLREFILLPPSRVSSNTVYSEK